MCEILMCYYCLLTRTNSRYDWSRAVPSGTKTICSETRWFVKLGVPRHWLSVVWNYAG